MCGMQHVPAQVEWAYTLFGKHMRSSALVVAPHSTRYVEGAVAPPFLQSRQVTRVSADLFALLWASTTHEVHRSCCDRLGRDRKNAEQCRDDVELSLIDKLSHGQLRIFLNPIGPSDCPHETVMKSAVFRPVPGSKICLNGRGDRVR